MFQLKHLVAGKTSPLVRLQKLSTKANRETLSQRKVLYGGTFPSNLLTKKQKTPVYLYVANAEAGELINKKVGPFLRQTTCDTVLELNPGPGLLTRTLLSREEKFRKIILMETLDHFMPHLEKFRSLYPERVKIKRGDVVSIGKLSFQDKIDNGMRVTELLQDVPKRAYSENPNMVVFGSVGSYAFFKHLINSLVFQNSLISYGRPEMYLIVPPPIYIHLTCNHEIGFMLYRSASILFQIFFEYRFIAQVPRKHFLPTQIEFNMSKHRKLSRIHSIDPEYLYLVRIEPRRNILDLCPAVDLPALWYFIKQNCVSRRNRVIPNLEKWIPGCGPRLIISTQSAEPAKPLYLDEVPEKLPKFSTRCTTISARDFYPNINIYTQFGDLSPSQMLTLFLQFRQWPEYSESSFLASLENSLLKMEAAADENVDGIGLTEEDDASANVFLEDPAADEVKQEAILEKPQRKAKLKNVKV